MTDYQCMSLIRPGSEEITIEYPIHKSDGYYKGIIMAARLLFSDNHDKYVHFSNYKLSSDNLSGMHQIHITKWDELRCDNTINVGDLHEENIISQRKLQKGYVFTLYNHETDGQYCCYYNNNDLDLFEGMVFLIGFMQNNSDENPLEKFNDYLIECYHRGLKITIITCYFDQAEIFRDF
jgi:hypothetical protein